MSGSKTEVHKSPCDKHGFLFFTSKEIDDPVFSACTWITDGEKQLAVIQQMWDAEHKRSKWSEVEPELLEKIKKSPDMQEYFNLNSKKSPGYEIRTIRQVLHGLKIKPPKLEVWESRLYSQNLQRIL